MDTIENAPEPNLRRAVRALLLDDEDRVLLCRFEPSHPAVPAGVPGVWAAPGGGIEPGESPLDALRRELIEETGLRLDGEPVHVWHQEIVEPGHGVGYDGLVNDYFLVRAGHFRPRGALADDDIAAEGISDFRWWAPADIPDGGLPDLFSPRDLGVLLAMLVQGAAPDEPLRIGL